MDSCAASAEAVEAERLAGLLKRHEWLMRCWLTNFCCNSYWERLPESWREALLTLSDEEMQELPAGLHPPDTWPSDLRELVLTARQLAPPEQAELDAPVERVSTSLLDGIPHVRNMGPKKQHEVLRLAPVVARAAARCGARTVVDLGSGHGYLSHVLAFHYGLHVIGIECAAHNCAAAHHRAWTVREKLRDARFRVSNPKAPDKGQANVAAHAAAAAQGGGDKARAKAARAAQANAAATAALEAAHEAARRGEPSPLVAHGGGSFTNLVVRLEPDASVPWLEATLQPAVDLIGRWLAEGEGEGGGERSGGERSGGERSGGLNQCGSDEGGGHGTGDRLAGGAAQRRKDGAQDGPQRQPAHGASHHRFLLVGLHTCGDLAPTLLRLAATSVQRLRAGAGGAEGGLAASGVPARANGAAGGTVVAAASGERSKHGKAQSSAAEDAEAQGSRGAGEASVAQEGEPSEAPTLPPSLRLRPMCVGVVSVGCCYHRVTEALPGEARLDLALNGSEGGSAKGTLPTLGSAQRTAVEKAASVVAEAADAPSADAAGAAGTAVPLPPPAAHEMLSHLTPEREKYEAERAFRAAHPELSNLPMSSVCQQLGVQLGEVALHLSLQAVWRWPARYSPVEETTGRIRHHLYRAVLECRLQQLRGEQARAEGLRLPSSGNVGTIPPCATFDEYARLACERVGVAYDAAEQLRMGALWETHRHLERPLRCFCMLRGVLSRPIERIVLLDRLLFLREAGLADATMREIFDPRTSPRNTAIIAGVEGLALGAADQPDVASAACALCDE